MLPFDARLHKTCPTHFKINHEHELDWVEDENDENDLFTFIVLAIARVTEFGCSSYVYSNRKGRSATLNKCNVIGHSTLKPISQFDIKIETGVTCLTEGIKTTGSHALRGFLCANSHPPLACMNLAQILSAADIASLPSHLPKR